MLRFEVVYGIVDVLQRSDTAFIFLKWLHGARCSVQWADSH